MAAASARYRSAGRPRSWRDRLRGLVLLALIALLLRSFVIAPFSIPSGSMLPTLWIGDYLLVAKWPYGYSRFSFPFHQPAFDGRILPRLPERGDVVVFHDPDGSGEAMIKRVVGLPGDRVALDAGRLRLNGELVERREAGVSAIPISPNSPCRVVPGATPMIRAGRCLYPTYLETLPGRAGHAVIDQAELGYADYMEERLVPPGHLFLLGDNRDDSADSRYPIRAGGIGMVPLDHLVGRAMLRFWSTDGSATWFKPWTWPGAMRPERVGLLP